jgi:peptidyl-prolyl cis-trans isomerase B (cyclophilin B)
MMTGAIHALVILSSAFMFQAEPAPPAPEPEQVVQKPLSAQIKVLIRPERTIIPVGSPVIIEFTVQNKTRDAITLAVPGALKAADAPEYGMGLPLDHVFSGVDFRALEVASEDNPRMGDRVMLKPQHPVPQITLAPFGSVGLRFDVSRFYAGLHQSGIYELRWRPYGGEVESPPIIIKVTSFKQAVIETDCGVMAMTLFYDKAPRHVENFIELANQRFYNGKTFHVLFPNQFMLGGCPNGDGTGKRPDGLTLEPEFNDTPFELGTVAMALIEGDTGRIPNSASSQFFICLADQPTWKGKYTAFGKITGPESLATLRRIGETPVDEHRRPLKPILIKGISIVDAPYYSWPAE